MKPLAQPPTTVRERALLNLAKRDKSNVPETFRAATEAAATVLSVARVGIWRLLPGERGIVTEELYLADEQRHTRGDTLCASDYPCYFSALLECRVIAASDACIDPRTMEYATGYLGRLGITSMLDVPIWDNGRLYGVLCHEHTGAPRQWRPDEEDFAGNMADLVALSVAAARQRFTDRRWNVAIHSMTEAIFVLDERGTVTETNAAAQALIDRAGGGHTLAERHQLLEYRDTSGRLIPHERWPLARLLRGEPALTDEIVGVWFRRTGELRYVRASIAPLRDGGLFEGAVAVLTGTTDEVHFERLKRDYLSALAHELKTPVAITKGYAQQLARSDDMPPRWRPMLDAVRKAADRMDNLIGDLIDVSNIILGRLVLHRTTVDLGELARAAVARTARTMATQAVQIVAPAPAPVLVDRARIKQVIRQLVDNAIRYSPPGREVDVRVVTEDSAVVLAVQDHGIGIPADKQHRIFEPFFRAHAGTTYDVGGLGIGLFLAHEVAARHQGAMWFESTEGRGSTFYLRLPRAEAP